MYPMLFVWLFTGCGIASLVMGFLHHINWLFVPPFVFGAYFFGSTIMDDVRRNTMGYGPMPLATPAMIPTCIGVTLWNALINTALFFVGWAASLLFSLAH